MLSNYKLKYERLTNDLKYIFFHFSTSLSLLDSDAVEVGTGPAVARSNPVNMPGARPMVPVLIESGSASIKFYNF